MSGETGMGGWSSYDLMTPLLISPIISEVAFVVMNSPLNSRYEYTHQLAFSECEC